MDQAVPPVFPHGASDRPGPDAAPLDGPGLFIRPDLLSPEECARLIARFALAPHPSAGGLVGGKPDAARAIRRCETLWLDDGPDTDWLFVRLARLLASANRAAFGFDLAEDVFPEGVQLIRYRADGGGHYDWHVDRGSRGLAQGRKLSISVQLSPHLAYAGGQLLVNPAGHALRVPRDQGTAAVFPSYVLHRVRPVSRGERFALVAWAHGPAFR